MLNDWDSFEIEESIIDTSPFSLDEIKDARKSLKNNKCPGEDLITAEMVKALEENGIYALQSLSMKFWRINMCRLTGKEV